MPIAGAFTHELLKLGSCEPLGAILGHCPSRRSAIERAGRVTSSMAAA